MRNEKKIVTNQLNEMNKVMLQFSDKTMQEVQRIINLS